MFAEMADKALFKQAESYAFDYADKSLERNIFPNTQALSQMDAFDQPMPDSPGDATTIIRELHDNGSPATVSQIGGRYFGLVNGSFIPTALAARWLSDFRDQNTPLYLSSPITSKHETVTEGWIRDLLGLPETVVAGFVSGSSMAIFCALVEARNAQ